MPDRIVYNELSSIELDLGFTAQQLYAVSNSLHRQYRQVKLPKANGGYRTLSIPSPLLKAIQRRITTVLLAQEPVSPYATAYRYGGGPLRNARQHVGRQMVVKLDIRGFFDHILYSDVKDAAFPADRYAEPLRVLLAMLCYYGDSLPQGAPTSPAISNIVLRSFDDAVGAWCRAHGIVYTRYCDDMTFSGPPEVTEVIPFVQAQLEQRGFYLNRRKMVVAHRGCKQTVTGLVVNRRLNVPAGYRKKLRQELYYCRKFGLVQHLAHIGDTTPPMTYARRLLGRVNYVLAVSPDREEFREYRHYLTEWCQTYTE
ncbi:MAG: RNA-directed DNA polymerase [Clostridia bacterium]|nr:RNA-directed DNA polymerase [Clostridia bacterium]